MSPDGKWTRWHQERFVNNSLNKNMAAAPNKRYIAIVKEIVQPQFQAKLLDWASSIDEQHKKVSIWPLMDNFW